MVSDWSGVVTQTWARGLGWAAGAAVEAAVAAGATALPRARARQAVALSSLFGGFIAAPGAGSSALRPLPACACGHTCRFGRSPDDADDGLALPASEKAAGSAWGSADPAAPGWLSAADGGSGAGPRP